MLVRYHLQACEAGKFSSANGVTTCADCPAGTKSTLGQASCTVCTSVDDYTDCTTCAANYYKNGASCTVMSHAPAC